MSTYRIGHSNHILVSRIAHSNLFSMTLNGQSDHFSVTHIGPGNIFQLHVMDLSTKSQWRLLREWENEFEDENEIFARSRAFASWSWTFFTQYKSNKFLVRQSFQFNNIILIFKNIHNFFNRKHIFARNTNIGHKIKWIPACNPEVQTLL